MIDFERGGYRCPTCGLPFPDIRALSDHEYERHEPPKNAVFLATTIIRRSN